MIPKSEFEKGIKQCEINALTSLHEAYRLFEKKEFRPAFFFGLLALEEVGKAGFILDKFGEPSISEDEWNDRNTILNHLAKIMKAKKLYENDVLEWFKTALPGLRGVKPGIIGWSKEELKEFWKYRNKVLFVDFNFRQIKWENPQELHDVEEKSTDIIQHAQSVFLALEELILKKGITPELRRMT